MSVIVTESSTTVVPTAEVVSDNIATEVTTTKNRVAEVNTNTYVLQSTEGSAFSGANGLPAWLGTALDDAIVNGTVSIDQAVEDLETAFNTLDTGIHQELKSVQNALVSTNTKLDTNVARLDTNVAGILALTTTKVTASEATSTALEAVKAEFNTPGTEANSIVLNIVSNNADAKGTSSAQVADLASTFTQLNSDTNVQVEANADIVNTRLTYAGIGDDGELLATGSIIEKISASVGDTTVTLDSIGSVLAGEPPVWDGVETPIIGMISTDGNAQYLGGTLGDNGWVDYNLTVLTKNKKAANSIGRTLFGTIDEDPYLGSTPAQPKDIWIATDAFYTEYEKDANGNDTDIVLSPQPYNYPKVKIRTIDNEWELLPNIADVQALNIQWAGGASKLLKGPDGSITGWSFGNGSGASSEFKVSADKFIISNGSDSHQPLEIDTVTGISRFKGIVSFTNAENTTGFKNSELNSRINSAQHKADSAYNAAISASNTNNTQSNQLDKIVLDSWVDNTEKKILRTTWSQIINERAKLLQAALDARDSDLDNSYINTATYTTAYNNLNYLLFNTINLNSEASQQIYRVEFKQKFNNYYAAEMELRRNITKRLNNNTTKLKTLFGTAESGYTKIDGGTITTDNLFVKHVRSYSNVTVPASQTGSYEAGNTFIYSGGGAVTPILSVSNGTTPTAHFYNSNSSASYTMSITGWGSYASLYVMNNNSGGTAIATYGAIRTTPGHSIYSGLNLSVYGKGSFGTRLHAGGDLSTSGRLQATNSSSIITYSGNALYLNTASNTTPINSGTGNESESGYYGLKTPDTIYAAGYLPFTGAHIGFTQYAVNVGDILNVTSSKLLTVSQSYVEVLTADVNMDKTVYGVCASIDNDIDRFLATDEYLADSEYIWLEPDDPRFSYSEVAVPLPEEESLHGDDTLEFRRVYTVKSEVQEYVDDIRSKSMTKLTINALGEGGINVCEVGGDILNGDFITSSEVPGKGVKQQDDIMHSYTVAKSLEDVIWADEEVGVSCQEINGFKFKLIACTYHCA